MEESNSDQGQVAAAGKNQENHSISKLLTTLEVWA